MLLYDRCDSWHPCTFHTLCVTSWQVLGNTRKFVVFDVVRYTSCQSVDKWVSSGHSWKTWRFFFLYLFWWNAVLHLQCLGYDLMTFIYLHAYTFPLNFNLFLTHLYILNFFSSNQFYFHTSFNCVKLFWGDFYMHKNWYVWT